MFDGQKERNVTASLLILKSEIGNFERTGNPVHLVQAERALEELKRALAPNFEPVCHADGVRDSDGTARRCPNRLPV